MKLTATLAALLLLALAAPALAIDEGAPDRDRHPHVGLLGFDVDGPGGPAAPALLCSGSVISDRHFLTAAHCIPAVPPGAEWVVTLEPGSPGAPVVLPGIFPENFPHPLTVAPKRGGVAQTHPDFDPERLAHDIAVIRFAKGTFAGIKPLAFPRLGLLDDLRGIERRSFRLVGYGADPEYGDEEPVFVIEGYRQTAIAAFQDLTRRQLVLRHGGCFGDSGSPQLLGDVAVSTFSDPGPDCRGPNLAQRLDTRSEQRFLERFIDLR